MWPVQKKENRQLLLKWPNLIPYSKLYKYIVTVLLLTSTPLIHIHHHRSKKYRPVTVKFLADITSFVELFATYAQQEYLRSRNDLHIFFS